MRVGVLVRVGVFVRVGVGVDVNVEVGFSVPVGVSVGVSVGVFVGVAVGVSVEVLVGVAVSALSTMTVALADGISVGAGWRPNTKNEPAMHITQPKTATASASIVRTPGLRGKALVNALNMETSYRKIP